jgi:hypothetical protein
MKQTYSRRTKRSAARRVASERRWVSRAAGGSHGVKTLAETRIYPPVGEPGPLGRRLIRALKSLEV